MVGLHPGGQNLAIWQHPAWSQITKKALHCKNRPCVHVQSCTTKSPAFFKKTGKVSRFARRLYWGANSPPNPPPNRWPPIVNHIANTQALTAPPLPVESSLRRPSHRDQRIGGTSTKRLQSNKNDEGTLCLSLSSPSLVCALFVFTSSLRI